MEAAGAQLAAAREAGNAAVAVAHGPEAAFASRARDPQTIILDGQVASELLASLDGIAAVACSAERNVLATIRAALARRPGTILPLITEPVAPERYVVERHVCVDTTAAGGNAILLAEAEA